MRFTNRSRLVAVPAAVALGLAMFAASLTWQVPAAQAGSGPLDAQASELVRLFNGARAAEGKAALAVDPFLASKARDGAIPCPDDAAQTIAGRAQDFAAYGTMSHNLRLCDAASYTLSGTLFLSVLQNSWSYWTVGEINLVNGGYGNGAFLYTYAGSQTWQTWTYSTTGHAMMGWQSSSSHWNIIMGSYDRVGCGGWASGSTYYYECAFSSGGSSPNGLQSPPSGSPFNNPISAPTPAPTVARTAAPPVAPPPAAPPVAPPAGPPAGPPAAPPAAPTVAPSALPVYVALPTSPAGGGGESAPATSSPDAKATSLIQGVYAVGAQTPAPNAQAAAMQENGHGIGPAGGASGLPAFVAGALGLLVIAGLAALFGWSALLSLRRRRETVG